jgi:hypothetical protein
MNFNGFFNPCDLKKPIGLSSYKENFTRKSVDNNQDIIQTRDSNRSLILNKNEFKVIMRHFFFKIKGEGIMNFKSLFRTVT